FEHAAYTLYRVLFGFSLAIIVGLPLGILMARFKHVENFFLPLVSALMPIPSFALVPLFMLWFGIGNLTTILIVLYAATFPVMFNAWSGVRSVNPIWLRAGAEMIAASDWGLGWVIFDSKEYLETNIMMAAIVVIGFIGFLFERLVFGSIEKFTVYRWGMVRTVKG